MMKPLRALPLRLLAGLWLLLLAAGVEAQPARQGRMPPVPLRLDSQLAHLRRPGYADTTRVKFLIGLSVLHMGANLDSARWYCEQALTLARRRGFGWGQAFALNNLGATYYYASDYPAAQRSFEAALRIARQVNQPEFIGHAYLGLGNVATGLRNAAASQAYFARAQQAYAACRPRYVDGELLVLHNRANGYLDTRELGAARALVKQGLGLLRQHPQAGSLHKLRLLLGTIQEQQQQSDSAAATWQQVAQASRAAHDAEPEGEAWLFLAQLALKRQQYPAALSHAQRASGLLRRLGADELVGEALDAQATALAALRRPEAYDTLRRYVSLRDTLLSQERLEAIATAQARFDRAEQHARIKELEQQRRIAGLEAEQRATRTRLLLGALAGGSLLLSLSLTGAYRRRQRRRDAALRHQLAADLHDDVGSLLSQIALQTDLLQEGLGSPEEQPAQWAEVAGNSRLAVRQLNDVVWNLDAHNDTVPNLLNRLRDYAHEVLVPTGRDVRFVGDEATGAAPELSAPVRRHLYLIYKEALHNILKYAPLNATVTVTLQRIAGQMVLEVVNSAPPTDPATAGAGRGSGHGLRNISERATAMGGTAHAAALAAGGLSVRVQVPLF
jgi:signal transduction histidine kinase